MSTSLDSLAEADRRIDEIEERLAALKKERGELRRARPPEPVEDWQLLDLDGRPVTLSALMGSASELLVIHNMGRGCRYCTLWADGLSGFHRHLESRVPWVLCSADAPDAARAFSRERGWPFRVVSGHGSGFAAAMGFAGPDGKPWPGASAFARGDGGRLVRTGKTSFGPGDDYCAVWPLFELLQGGTGNWSPR